MAMSTLVGEQPAEEVESNENDAGEGIIGDQRCNKLG